MASELSPAEQAAMLKETSHDARAAAWDEGYGAGRDDEAAAMAESANPYRDTSTEDTDPAPPELAAIRERTERDLVLDPDDCTGLGSELMQAHRDRAALLAALDAPRAPLADTTAATQGCTPMSLSQAADALHGWADDLTDGRRREWPHGEPAVIRGIRTAADWVRARARYEAEQREQQAASDDPPCVPITIHTYGLTDEGWDALFDRVAAAAHRLDETVTCIGHNECATCDDTTE